jgi:hypothetical protein
MASYFSDNFHVDGVTTPTASDSQKRAHAGIAGGRVRYKRAFVTIPVTAVSTETIRFMSMRSGDRIHEMKISNPGDCGTATMNLGLYLPGDNHSGTVLDADLFMSAEDMATANDRVDAFDESSTLDNQDRGKALWQLYAAGAGSDSVDPMLDYDITGVLAASMDTAAEEVLLEVWYTAGD